MMSYLGARRQDWLAWPATIFDSPYLAWTTEKTKDRSGQGSPQGSGSTVDCLLRGDDRGRPCGHTGAFTRHLARYVPSWRAATTVSRHGMLSTSTPATRCVFRRRSSPCGCYATPHMALHDAGCIREQIRAITGHSMSSINEILRRCTALTVDQAGTAREVVPPVGLEPTLP
jgi:hypothetical protein